MNKKVNLLYLFALRLPFFLMLNSFFNLFLAASYKIYELAEISLTLGLHFICLFFCWEKIEKKAFRIAFQLAISAFFVGVAHFAFNNGDLFLPLSSMIFVLTLYSFQFDQADYKSGHINTWIFLISIAILVLQFISYPAILKLCVGSLIVMVLCKYLCKHIYSMNIFVHSYLCRSNSKAFLNNLAKNSLKLIFVYLIAIFIFALPLFLQNPPETKPIINESEEEQLIGVLGNIKTQKEEETSPSETEAEENIAAEEPPSFQLEPPINYEPPPYRDILQKILLCAVIIAIFVLVAILSKRKNKSVQEEEDEYEELELTECVSEKKMKKTKGSFFSYNQAVRRIFIRKVNRYQKKGLALKKSSTAQNILSDISQYESVTQLNETYHKARYSNEKMTKEDVERLK